MKAIGLVLLVLLTLTGCGTSHLVRTMSQEGYNQIEVNKTSGKKSVTIRGKRPAPVDSQFWSY